MLPLRQEKAKLLGFSDIFDSANGVCALTDTASNSVQVLSLRQEKAKLLGFSNFAELSMSKKVGTRIQSTSLCVYLVLSVVVATSSIKLANPAMLFIIK